MRLLKLSLVLGAVHFLVVAAVFLVFGLGLEGPTIGGSVLSVLLQPMLSVPLPVHLGPGAQNVLMPVNSLLWGVGIALLIRWVRPALFASEEQ